VKGNAAPIFPDEWDFLIENYAYGASHPDIVDSIEQMAFNRGELVPVQGYARKTSQTAYNPSQQTPVVSEEPIAEIKQTDEPNAKAKQSNTIVEKPTYSNQPVTAPVFLPPAMQTNEERFTSRTKILQHVIPIKGDSIELRFYDNAEIDGDSIAVFLNGRLLKEHILLAEEAYVMKIAATDLQSDNELVMVAENLGSIPPNTSLMVAIVEDKRYEAHLQSTEGSSALVRLVKP
jgi:hypothetical protein